MSTVKGVLKKNRWIVGLTGGIASGKSTALAEFARLHVPTLSADELAREALRPKTTLARAVVRKFGKAILRPRGVIDRGRLGEIVFDSPRARRWLEGIVHPFVIKRIRAFSRKQHGLAVIDIPLLFEAHLESLVDEIVVVHATQDQQRKRLFARSGLSSTEVNRRLAAQWPLVRKCRRADRILDNRASRASLKAQVRQYLLSFRKRFRQ